MHCTILIVFKVFREHNKATLSDQQNSPDQIYVTKGVDVILTQEPLII